ncbi:lish protein [Coniochaeta ligniaria NRRL 30616]|uniref:Lish protein n=1 Tax=Coniochaeta ligniaria NRRL 30616 TaxID=1408157 RepID=A0A1J7IHX2_9PEZI|nr:lish protein [Coniochaeta ligniaria NRRL 30616]
MKELLDSDRVNYLVWRFLLESNYRETAAKFQKEWHIQTPHRHFDFAPHVKNYALVSVLNKGLVYEDLERQYAESHQAPRDVPATAEAKPTGVFGPLIPEPAHSEEDDDGEDSEPEEVENSRKRPVDRQQLNGSPVKRQRLSNGYEAESATDAMEIDHPAEENNHAYPSPLEAEQVVSPTPRTGGPEQGTQVDKVHELSQETTFLRLTTPSQFATTSPVRANDNPIVLHCEWNPRDPAILAAAGTDALARIWTVSRATAPEDMSDHVQGVQRPYHNLVEDDVPPSAGVSAMSWNWDGTAIAIAWEISNKARISIWSADGAHIHRFDGVEPPVIKLRWSPNNALLLGIAPENGGTLATVFSATSASSMSYFLERHNLHEDGALDATWTSETEFVLCGGDLLLALRCTDDGIVPSRKFETHSDENFFQVQFDWRSKLLATSSEKGTIDIWDESGQRNTMTAHQDTITCLQWQPLQSNPRDDLRLIASGGEDGALCIWNARESLSQPKYFMTMKDPVVALAFTPDGAFIAGATAHQILIWKVGDPQIPRASWSRMPHPGWLSPRVLGEPEEEDQHCLGWDVTGQRLAYATNSRLAVINFR